MFFITRIIFPPLTKDEDKDSAKQALADQEKPQKVTLIGEEDKDGANPINEGGHHEEHGHGHEEGPKKTPEEIYNHMIEGLSNKKHISFKEDCVSVCLCMYTKHNVENFAISGRERAK